MIRRYSAVPALAIAVGDALATTAAWFVAYFSYAALKSARGSLGILERLVSPAPLPALDLYLGFLPFILVVTLWGFRLEGLYDPERARPFPCPPGRILRGAFLAFLLLLAATFFYREVSFSRGIAALYLALQSGLVLASRAGFRRLLMAEGMRLGPRYRVLIVGAGRLGQAVAQRILENPWASLRIQGFLDDRDERQGKDYFGAAVIGRLADLVSRVHEHRIHQVFVCLPRREADRVDDVVAALAEETVDIRIVPDVLHTVSLHMHVEDFLGLPLVSIRESPYHGWNRFAKRAFDVAAAGAILLLASPVLAGVAILVKLTSRGPLFYRQERMGLDGRTFRMLKFRSMRVDAEAGTGAVWAAKDDPRRTPIGKILRMTSLDELPQFFNVLMGDMSIVGPRPERPVFIEEFKKAIPRYMLRHKMKAGITGWAQINGWRGNTSLRKRIQYDLYYIENWSLALDLRIILMTPFRGMVARNAY